MKDKLLFINLSSQSTFANKILIVSVNWFYINLWLIKLIETINGDGCSSTCTFENGKSLEEAFERPEIFIPGAGTAVPV